MAIIKTKVFDSSSDMPNQLLRDKRLRFNDLGIMVFLLSKGRGYEINAKVLMKEKKCSKDQIYASFKRLREFGYMLLATDPYGISKWFVRGDQSEDWSNIVNFKNANKYGRQPIYVWQKTRARIFNRDGNTCFYCGYIGLNIECDHYIPISRGGSNSDDNLVTACKPCNRKKKSMMPETFIKLIGGKHG